MREFKEAMLIGGCSCNVYTIKAASCVIGLGKIKFMRSSLVDLLCGR